MRWRKSMTCAAINLVLVAALVGKSKGPFTFDGNCHDSGNSSERFLKWTTRKRKMRLWLLLVAGRFSQTVVSGCSCRHSKNVVKCERCWNLAAYNESAFSLFFFSTLISVILKGESRCVQKQRHLCQFLPVPCKFPTSVNGPSLFFVWVGAEDKLVRHTKILIQKGWWNLSVLSGGGSESFPPLR